jgi:hypothetical protein
MHAPNPIGDGLPGRERRRRTSGCTGREPRQALSWGQVAVRLVPVIQVFGGGESDPKGRGV